MFGKILVYFLFGLSLLSSLLYILAEIKKNKQISAFARSVYFTMIVGILTLSGYLLYHIIIHNFQFTYIWSYSSTNLPLNLLISSFYAGQEGSFLLWALFIVLIGGFLIPYSKKHNYEELVMGLYSIVLSFLFVILIFKSPFEYVWDSFKESNIPVGFTPQEGRGLNPILQNYWISIHPPILFVGYAAMTVPYVFAIAGLIRRDYQRWIRVALPWTLFASGILGLGIMLGGFWAYETLGWGGFWAWDPVENSSLLPWLISVTLVHTMLVQKSTGGLRKTNFVLAIIGFILVLYATYLTRSGVLGDSSVHSFVDPGQIVNTLLVTLLLLFLLIGIGVLIFRIKDIPINKSASHTSSKEFALSLGSIVILAGTIIVLIGTSFPLISGLFGATQNSMDAQFYNVWMLPIAILILLINAFSIYMNWRSSKWDNVLKKSLIYSILSLIVSIALIFFGVNNFQYLLLAFASIFSLFINIDYIVRNIKLQTKSLGAYISHLGISLLMLGTLFSGAYSLSQSLVLHPDKPQTAFGYKFTLKGKEQIEKQYNDREKFQYMIKVERDGSSSQSIVNPIMYWSAFNEFQAPFFEPGIKRYVSQDLYIAPISVQHEESPSEISLKKGESVSSPYDAKTKITLLKYDMSRMQSDADHNHSILGAILKIEDGKSITIDTAYALLDLEKQNFSPLWLDIPGRNLKIGFVNFVPGDNLEQAKSVFAFTREIFTVEVTLKPFINFVWIGVIAVVFGFFYSISRHVNGSKKTNKEKDNSVDNDTEIVEIINEDTETHKI